MRKQIVLVLFFIACLFPSALADCDLFLKTYDQTAWGTSPSGNNSAAYRNAQFPSAFPQGITIGKDGGFTLTFTNAKAVQLFLPSTGTAKPLNQSMVNATSSSAGILGGEVLSLALNVGFDAADPSFAPSTEKLADMIVLDGICAGMTVQQVLNEGNAILSGASSAFSPAQIQNCTLQINKNFLNASVNNGHLACAASSVVNETANVSVNVTSNTTNATLNETGNVSVNVTLPQEENMTQNDTQNSTNQNVSVELPVNTTTNQTSVNTTNATIPSIFAPVNISIAPWYPKNASYVFVCNANFTATNYTWYFGDGEKLVQIKNWNVYHTYRRPGVYPLRCTAHSPSTSVNATMQVVVR